MRPNDVARIIIPPTVEPIAIATNDLFQSKPRNQLRIEAGSGQGSGKTDKSSQTQGTVLNDVRFALFSDFLDVFVE